MRAYEFSPEHKKRKKAQRARQEARWASKSGSVTVTRREVEAPKGRNERTE